MIKSHTGRNPWQRRQRCQCFALNRPECNAVSSNIMFWVMVVSLHLDVRQFSSVVRTHAGPASLKLCECVCVHVWVQWCARVFPCLSPSASWDIVALVMSILRRRREAREKLTKWRRFMFLNNISLTSSEKRFSGITASLSHCHLHSQPLHSLVRSVTLSFYNCRMFPLFSPSILPLLTHLNTFYGIVWVYWNHDLITHKHTQSKEYIFL